MQHISTKVRLLVEFKKITCLKNLREMYKSDVLTDMLTMNGSLYTELNRSNMLKI